MDIAKHWTAAIAAGAIALAMIATPGAQASTPKRHHAVPSRTPRAVLRIKHVGAKTVLVPTTRPARPIKVQAPPQTKNTPGVLRTVPGGSPDPRPLGTPNGVAGTGVPGPGVNH